MDRPQIKTALGLFLVSFIVRLGFFIPVLVYQVPPLYDEAGYYARAIGFKNILTGLIGEQTVSGADLRRAYGGGVWPPLHPFLLGLGLSVLGEGVAHARLVVVLLSALTTPLVYLLTQTLSTTRAGVYAALVHIVYPSFIAFSHYLWSETSYIFLLLGCVLCVVLSLEAKASRPRIVYAGIAGCFLGLSGLTRAAALPLLVMMPVALAWYVKKTSDAIRVPAAMLIGCWLMVLPWQATLLGVEGRFVLLSTGASYNLYLGNNPWIPDGFGSSSGHHSSKRHVAESILAYSEQHNIDADTAAWRLATEYIKHDIPGALQRCFERLRMLWTSDFFALRHIFHAVYPPMSDAVVVCLGLSILLSYLVYTVLVFGGSIDRHSGLRHKGLLLSLVVASMIPPVMTIATSRLHLPLLALLLPVAGSCLANLECQSSKIVGRRILAGLVCAVLFVVCIAPSFPIVLSHYLRPSHYYNRPIGLGDSILGSNTLFADTIILKSHGQDSAQHVRVTLADDGHWFDSGLDSGFDPEFEPAASRSYDWSVRPDTTSVRLTIISKPSHKPVEIVLFSDRWGQSDVIQPLTAAAWRQWQATGLAGIEYMWDGGGFPPVSAVVEDVR